MTIIEQGACRIEGLNSEGLGIGRTKGGIVELPYTLPGELVEFTRHHYRGKSNCILEKIIEPSIERVTPACKYFGACGGCLLQHLDEDSYQNYKYNLISTILDSANITTHISPLTVIPGGKRRKVNFQFLKKNDKIYLGFHRFHSHQIINIDSCPAAKPNISHLIMPLKEMLGQILSNGQKGQAFITQGSNGVDVMLELLDIVIPAKAGIHKIMKERMSPSLREGDMVSEGDNLNNNIIRLAIGDKEKQEIIYQSAAPQVKFDEIAVDIDYNSFLQASFDADQILADLVLKYLPTLSQKQKIVDLFCGRGTFTLPLSKYCSVDGFEIEPSALAALAKAATSANLPIRLEQKDLFNAPLQTKELNDYNFAVINPPRKGALTQCQQLAASKVENIVYVSCDPGTFARDAKILLEGNYQLMEVTPVDQFYWTPHLEIVGRFKLLTREGF